MNLLRSISAKLAAIALAFTATASLSAQPPDTKPAKRPPVTASLVPIGSSSDSYWVGDGPGMRAIPLDPEAAPPATLCIRSRGGFQVIPAILNRPSIALPVTAGVLRVYANQDAGEDEDPPVFGDFRIPTTPGHYDVFLNRAESRKGWDKPEVVVLSAAPGVFPPGSFRIINLWTRPVSVKLGPSAFNVAPRGTQIAAPAAGANGKLLPVQAVHPHGQQIRTIIRTGIRLSAGQRVNLVIYPGRDAEKPCEATWFYQSDPEFVPAETKPSGP